MKDNETTGKAGIAAIFKCVEETVIDKPLVSIVVVAAFAAIGTAHWSFSTVTPEALKQHVAAAPDAERACLVSKIKEQAGQRRPITQFTLIGLDRDCRDARVLTTQLRALPSSPN